MPVSDFKSIVTTRLPALTAAWNGAGTRALETRIELAHGIATRRLNLEDVGPHVREQLCRKRSRQKLREIKNANALEKFNDHSDTAPALFAQRENFSLGRQF